MSGTPIRLTLRQQPHLDFVIGYPGLVTEPPLQPAAIEGTVEVRVQQQAVHTQWLKVELKKTEVVQTSKGIRRYFELIGSKEQILWAGEGKPSCDNEKFAPLDTGDYSFSIPIPPGLPPSIVLDKSKNTGIVYHLVATAKVKLKSKGLFGGSSNSFKPPSLVTQIAEVTVEKHELNPAWPIYQWQAENSILQNKQANLTMRLKRDTVIFGGNDPVGIEVELKSERTAPIKVTRIELQLKELLTTKEPDAGPVKYDSKKSSLQINEVLSLKANCNNILYQNENMLHAFSTVFPVQHHHYTVQNAKHLEVRYIIRVRAVVEIPKEAKVKKSDPRPKEQAIKEIILDNVPVMVSPWSRKDGNWLMKEKIKQTPRNLRRPSISQAATSSTSSPAAAVRGPASIGQSVTQKPAQAGLTSWSQLDPATPSNSQISSSSAQPAARRASMSAADRPVQSNGLSNPAVPAPTPNSPPMPALQPSSTRSSEDERALAIEKGKRLSSWPPPPPGGYPAIAVTAPSAPASSAPSPTNATAGNHLAGSSRTTPPGVAERQTKSDHGHSSVIWRPPQAIASLDGHAATMRQSSPPSALRMDGAYPSIARSPSNAKELGELSFGRPPVPQTHRRVFSDGPQQIRNSGHSDLPAGAALSEVPDNRRASVPSFSNIPFGNGRRGNSVYGQQQWKPRMHVDTAQNGYPTRKNTLSTITGSLPSSNSSPATEARSDPIPQREWATAEQEKERLYNEAKERARITQEMAGNPVPEASQYRSVQDRTPTPLSLMRSVSNPTPSRQGSYDMPNIDGLTIPSKADNRLSTASTHLDYLAYSDENGNPCHGSAEPTPLTNSFSHGSTGNGMAEYTSRPMTSGQDDHESEPVTVSPQPGHRADSSSQFQPSGQSAMSPLSPSSAAAARFAQLDPQKMAYLKALAAREAYQQRIAGVAPQPLSALEEKQRLQQMYEEEERRAENGQDAWREAPQLSDPAGGPLSSSQSNLPWAPQHQQSRSVSYATRPDFTPQPSVYLTPDASISSHYQGNGPTHNPYFESPNSSSSHLASNTSTLSQSYRRDPAVKQGKQRRLSSMYTDENDSYEHLRSNEGGETAPSMPPARPPKSREVVHDSFRHLDTPVSPDASEYERRLLWGRQSQSSHYGH